MGRRSWAWSLALWGCTFLKDTVLPVPMSPVGEIRDRLLGLFRQQGGRPLLS